METSGFLLVVQVKEEEKELTRLKDLPCARHCSLL